MTLKHFLLPSNFVCWNTILFPNSPIQLSQYHNQNSCNLEWISFMPPTNAITMSSTKINDYKEFCSLSIGRRGNLLFQGDDLKTMKISFTKTFTSIIRSFMQHITFYHTLSFSQLCYKVFQHALSKPLGGSETFQRARLWWSPSAHHYYFKGQYQLNCCIVFFLGRCLFLYSVSIAESINSQLHFLLDLRSTMFVGIR